MLMISNPLNLQKPITLIEKIPLIGTVYRLRTRNERSSDA